MSAAKISTLNNTLQIIALFLVLGLCISGRANASTTDYTKWQPGHYVRYTVNAKNLEDPIELAEQLIKIRKLVQKRSNFKGILLQTRWKYFERQENVYDFSFIDEVLKIVESENKYLLIRIMDRDFSKYPNVVLPEYIIRKGWYWCNPKGAPCYSRIWNAEVMDRFIILFRKFVEKYDSHPRLVGIVTEETATGGASQTQNRSESGYNPGEYTDQIVRFNKQISAIAKHTIIFQSLNSLSGGEPNELLDKIVNTVSESGDGLSHPDTFPCENLSYENCKRDNFAPYYYERTLGSKGTQQIPVMAQLQRANQFGWTPKELHDTAYRYLGANFMVWNAWLKTIDTELVPLLEQNGFSNY